MKFVFITLFLFSSLVSSVAFSQAPLDATKAPESPEPVADVQGPYVKPTPAQKARVHAAAKKAKAKKPKKAKLKAKSAKKAKKTKKSTK